jgi:hypothetical protein
MFWSQERVNAWYNAIFPTGTEICQNLISLCPHTHAYWDRAYFALKPIRISDDKKRLDVQLFWLSSNPSASEVSLLQIPPLSASDQGPNSTKLWNVDSEKKLCSGDIVSFETDDPVTRPLPDIRLLEMQWFLHRVTAMSGGAEPQGEEFYNENSYGDFVTALQDGLDTYTEDDWDMEIE